MTFKKSRSVSGASRVGIQGIKVLNECVSIGSSKVFHVMDFLGDSGGLRVLRKVSKLFQRVSGNFRGASEGLKRF